ncbi:MAG: class I adenylate-forming enzyme family protein [Pseudorhodoplanes sp.]
MNVADLLTARAVAAPQDIAVISDAHSLSLASMDAAVWSMAHKIREAGLTSSDVVGLRAKDPLLHLIAALALARMGIAHLAVSSDASASAQSAQLLQRIGAVAVLDDRKSQGAGIANCIPIDLESTLAGNGAPKAALRVDGGDRILHFRSSSGTTGRPKLVGATHAAMIASIEREQIAIRYMPGERYMTPVGVHFAAPKQRYIACMVSGSTAVMPPTSLSIGTLLELVDRHDVRHFSCVPSQAYDVASNLPPGRQRLPNMRCFRLSAAPSDASLIDLLHERICSNVVISYGCNEIGAMTATDPQSRLRRPLSVGRPMPGIAIEVVSTANEPMPNGGTGIVRVRSPCMPSGYFDDPQATAHHFRDGWFYPGDLGSMSDDSVLTLMGRADDIMIFDGSNISPHEIEVVLNEFPGVREAAAFPLRSLRSYQLPAAAVVLEQGVSMNELNRFVRERLASSGPTVIFAVDRMPRNEGGKIMKRKLAELAERYMEASNGKRS